MVNNNNSILIFTTDEEDKTLLNEDVCRGLDSFVKNASIKTSEVTVNALKENMFNFLNSLDTIIKTSPKEIGGLSLEEMEISVQIDGKGNVGITGLLGAEVATQGGIKFVLRKKL